jgi:CubicO group peptidase (beta-lactamase class C family)
LIGAASALVLAAGGLTSAAADVRLSPPASVGFSPTGLSAINGAMHGLVDQKKLAGVTTLVARHGKVVHFDVYGRRDAESGAPIAKDTIFRIASMTKPITGVAMMQLYEQGKWAMDDPVAKHIPEFANLKVKGPNGTLVEQTSPMTMRQLMSHTAGFDVSAGYEGANISPRDQNLKYMIGKLATLPLADQPGADWNYGPSVNIQGYVVEKLSGERLDRYFERHIFAPLGLMDTGFSVAPGKAGRVARVHTYGPDGTIVAAPQGPEPTVQPVFLAGSGGLYSTTEDYWRFAQGLLDIEKGRASGARRILKPETVKLMRRNVLNDGVLVDLYGPSQQGTGFGMDFAVVLDPLKANSPQGRESYYWGGAFGTWFWIDPTNDLVFVGMIQNLNGSTPGRGTPEVRSLSQRLTYQALTDPAR